MNIAGTVLEADIVRAVLGPLFLLSLAVIVYLKKNKVGRLFMSIGVLHVLGGAVVGREPLARIVREGFIGEGDSALGNAPVHMEKELAFWFFLWGAYAFILGYVATWSESRGERLPERVGWQLVAVNLLSAILVPKGGFWLCLIPSAMIIWQARSANTPGRRAV